MTRSSPLQRKTRECRIAASSQTSSTTTIKEPPDISDYTRVAQQGVASWCQGHFDRTPFSLLDYQSKTSGKSMQLKPRAKRKNRTLTKEMSVVIVTKPGNLLQKYPD